MPPNQGRQGPVMSKQKPQLLASLEYEESVT